MKLSASVMAHPDRAPYVADLLAALGRPVPVHYDTEGPPSGNADRGWRTAHGAWVMYDPAADFHLLLQDDALVCPDLLAGLAGALEHVPPDAVVCPYLGKGGATPHRWRRMAADADRAGASWVVSSKLMWGVGIILPVSRIGEMIGVADRLTGITDDMRVAGWIEKTRTEVWYTWPSLIDHRAVPSLTKHHAKDRRAERHHEGSALELDWRGPVVVDPVFQRSRGQRSGPSANRQVTSLSMGRRTGKVGERA
jgi:hypothetical protein